MINRSQNHSYNPQKNRLISTSQASFSYDDEGQIKTKTQTSTSNTTNYSFDYAHRLTSQGNNQYTYDGVGNRIKAIRNGSTTKYIYDAAGNLLAEANSANQITRYYIYGHGMLGFIETASNQLYIYHHDGTGHTVAITDQSQNIVNSYAYDPYGNIMGESETIAQPFKYVGQLGVQAEDNGLYYMRARYYDAEIGRFISEDPIGFAGGINLYAYVGGNPVLFTDPSGLKTYGFSLNLNAGWGVGVTGGANVVMDDHGNIGLQIVKGGGGDTPGASLSVNYEYTNAENIYQLEGLGGQTGVDGGVGATFEGGTMFGTGYSGFYFGAGIGPGTPVGASGYVTSTRTIASTNIINEAASATRSFFMPGTSKPRSAK